MLVLSRHTGEEIIIDGHIRVVVVRIDETKVRIGIDAPAEISVHRGEIQRRIDAQAAEPMSDDPATGD